MVLAGTGSFAAFKRARASRLSSTHRRDASRRSRRRARAALPSGGGQTGESEDQSESESSGLRSASEDSEDSPGAVLETISRSLASSRSNVLVTQSPCAHVLGKCCSNSGETRYSNSAYALTNRSRGSRRNVNLHLYASPGASDSSSRLPTLGRESPDRDAANFAAADARAVASVPFSASSSSSDITAMECRMLLLAAL